MPLDPGPASFRTWLGVRALVPLSLHLQLQGSRQTSRRQVCQSTQAKPHKLHRAQGLLLRRHVTVTPTLCHTDLRASGNGARSLLAASHAHQQPSPRVRNYNNCDQDNVCPIRGLRWVKSSTLPAASNTVYAYGATLCPVRHTACTTSDISLDPLALLGLCIGSPRAITQPGSRPAKPCPLNSRILH